MKWVTLLIFWLSGAGMTASIATRDWLDLAIYVIGTAIMIWLAKTDIEYVSQSERSTGR